MVRTSSSSSRVGSRLALLLLLSASCLISSTAALVELPETEVAELLAGVQLPVTNWLMSSEVPALQRLAWRKIGEHHPERLGGGGCYLLAYPDQQQHRRHD
jgi:hypothetical protein